MRPRPRRSRPSPVTTSPRRRATRARQSLDLRISFAGSCRDEPRLGKTASREQIWAAARLRVYRKAMNPVNRRTSPVAGRSNATGAARPLLLGGMRRDDAHLSPSPPIQPTLCKPASLHRAEPCRMGLADLQGLAALLEPDTEAALIVAHEAGDGAVSYTHLRAHE